jgi:branched-chain amino acid aminotransferase
MFNNTELKFIWKDGEFIRWDDSKVHILSHTLHYGTGVFEGVRAYSTSNGPAIFRLEDHTKRLFNAADILKIKVPFSQKELNDVQKELFTVNDLEEGYIRPIIYLGNESQGLRSTNNSVHVAVAAWEWPSYMSPEAKINGISVIKSSHPQFNNPIHSNNKIIGTYVNSTLALHEAIDKGADEAILFDSEGNISEGSGENIFIVIQDKIYTPTTKYCLNGITRQSVIQIANDSGISVTEKNLSYQDLAEADEAFFTGTAVEITPITRFDGSIIGSGKRGKITELIQKIYSEAVRGKSSKYINWLSYAS